jgi:hypothetical protein
MAAVASIVIEVQDAQATAAMQRVNAQAVQLGQNFQPVQRISEQTFNNIEGGALKARESAALLGEEFGVKIPRALRGVIAESSLIGPAMTAAFTGLAVLGFVDIIKLAVDHLTGFSAALAVIQKQNSELMASATAASKTLMGPQTLEQVNTRILATTKSVEALNQQLGLTGNLWGDALTKGVAKYSQSQALAVEELDKQKALLNDLYGEQAKLWDEQNRTNPVEILKNQNAARLVGLEGIAKINEAARGETQVIRLEIAKQIADKTVGNSEINKIEKDAIAQRTAFRRSEGDTTRKLAEEVFATSLKGIALINDKEADAIAEQKVLLDRGLIDFSNYTQRKLSIEAMADNQRKELAKQNAEEIARIEEQAAVDVLMPWQRSYAQISMDTQRRLREIQQALKDTRISAEDAARFSAAAWQEQFAKTRDLLATDLETLFDNITSGNIGKYFLTQFKHLVFQMVATWILGMQQMRGASQQSMGSGGGILGSIFGGIFGGGSGGGVGGGSQGGIGSLPGVITNWGNQGVGIPLGNGDFGGEVTGGSSSGGGILGALGLSAGGGAGIAGTTLPAGAGPAGSGAAGGAIGQLLGKLFSHGAGPLSGSMLAAGGIALLADSFRKGGILGGLEGAAGGALTGFAIGGPIGALIGGIAGFIAGIWGHSTKKARLAIEADIKRKAATIEDAYNLFQMDWPTSRDQLEQLRQAGVDALKQAGVKDINRSRVGHVDQWIDKAEKEIDATQAERNRRTALAFGPAEFRVGGFVGAGSGGAIPSWFAGTAMHFAGGGAVPAILHAGEYVMRPEAVAKWGVNRLSQMNAGSGGESHIHLHINAIDKESFRGWLNRYGATEIVRSLRRGSHEGRW